MMHSLFQRVLNSTRVPTCAAEWAKAQIQGLLEKWGCNDRARHVPCPSSAGCMGPAFHMWFAPLVFIKEPDTHPLPLCIPHLQSKQASPSSATCNVPQINGVPQRNWEALLAS